MKILVIGSTGTIGKAIYNNLKLDHINVYGSHRNNKEYPIDITDTNSIKTIFEQLPQLDAVINAAGTATWKPMAQLTEKDYHVGIQSKLMGQVNLVHIAKDYLKENGSITLTTGILAEHYEPNAVGLSLVNGAIHSFVHAASNELDRGIRINVVAPGAIAGDFPVDKKFADHYPVDLNDVVEIYKQSITQNITGQILKKY